MCVFFCIFAPDFKLGVKGMNMKRMILGVLLAWVFWPLQAANEIVHVHATYEYVSSNARETPEQAERTAIERAKLQALEEKFGVDVTSVTNTLTASRTNGNEAAAETNVFSIGGTSVRGEWIETTKQEVLDKSFVNGFWVVKVRVEGKARNNTADKADIHFAFVKDVQDLEPPVTFRDHNDLFLHFSSPVAGYLCVYLVDEAQNAYCLLPYMSQQKGSQAVQANKDYVFFSTKFDKFADEYTVSCERSSEQNALYVVFSPHEFTKAADKDGGKNFRDEGMPRELKYEALLKWLSKIQTRDPEMVVRTSVITIRK